MAIQIPGIYVDVRGNLTQLRTDMRQAREIVASSAVGMSNAMNNVFSNTQINRQLNSLIRNLGTVRRTAGLAGNAFDNISVDLGQLRSITGLTATQFERLQAQMFRTQASRQFERSLRNIQRQAGLTNAQMVLMRARLGDLRGAARTAGSALLTAFRGMRSTILGVTAAFAGLGYAAVRFGQNVFDAGIKVDQLTRAFRSIFGSTEAANREFAFLRQLARDLGQNFYELADGFKGISAAARGTSLEGEKLRFIFRSVTEASTALGLSADQVRGIFYAFSQMISKNTVSAEELRRQLGDRLYGAFQLAAKAIGVTTQELDKMLKSGTLMAGDLLPKLAQLLHQIYGPEAQRAVNSYTAAVKRFDEAWMDFKVTVGESGFMDAAAGMLRELGQVLQSPEMQDAARELGKGLSELIKIIPDAVRLLGQIASAIANVTYTIDRYVHPLNDRLRDPANANRYVIPNYMARGSIPNDIMQQFDWDAINAQIQAASTQAILAPKTTRGTGPTTTAMTDAQLSAAQRQLRRMETAERRSYLRRTRLAEQMRYQQAQLAYALAQAEGRTLDAREAQHRIFVQEWRDRGSTIQQAERLWQLEYGQGWEETLVRVQRIWGDFNQNMYDLGVSFMTDLGHLPSQMLQPLWEEGFRGLGDWLLNWFQNWLQRLLGTVLDRVFQGLLSGIGNALFGSTVGNILGGLFGGTAAASGPGLIAKALGGTALGAALGIGFGGAPIVGGSIAAGVGGTGIGAGLGAGALGAGTAAEVGAMGATYGGGTMAGIAAGTSYVPVAGWAIAAAALTYGFFDSVINGGSITPEQAQAHISATYQQLDMFSQAIANGTTVNTELFMGIADTVDRLDMLGTRAGYTAEQIAMMRDQIITNTQALLQQQGPLMMSTLMYESQIDLLREMGWAVADSITSIEEFSDAATGGSSALDSAYQQSVSNISRFGQSTEDLINSMRGLREETDSARDSFSQFSVTMGDSGYVYPVQGNPPPAAVIARMNAENNRTGLDYTTTRNAVSPF
jgi:tape measure domain-containing protein